MERRSFLGSCTAGIPEPRKGEDGVPVEARAVVLVDVYLPVAAWSGWQFPRSRASAAAAVFKHLRWVSAFLCIFSPMRALVCLCAPWN